MGAIEAGAKRNRQKRNLQRAVLLSVGIAGVLAVAAVAPNAVQLLKTTGINARLRYRTKSALGRLKAKGEVEFVERDGVRYARPTARGGQILALHREQMALQERKPRRWDRRYRLIIFDIPERRKKTRDQLRQAMRETGFLRIQDSAWVYPYDCEEFVALLKARLHLGKDVLYAVVEEIGNDAPIRAHFNLPAKS